jgi:MFS family permease
MDETSLRYQGWRVAIAGAVSVFLASLFIYTFGVFLIPLSEEFSWSRESISAAYGVAAMAAAMAAVPLGWLFDRFSPARIVIPSQVLTAGAFASLAALTPNLWHLYVTFGVLGVTGTAMSAVAYSRVVSSWFAARRGMALAVVVCGGAIGGLLQPTLAEVMTRVIGWRGAFLAFGALFLLVGVPTVAALVQEPSAVTSAASSTDSPSVSRSLTSRVFWFQMIVLFCSAMAQNAALVHFVPLLTDRGVAPSEAAMAMSAMGGASLVGRLLTGWFLDRFFAPYVSFALLTIVALGTLLLSGAQSFAVATLAGMCIGFGIGGESDVTPYLFSRYFGLRSLSTLYSVTWVATGVAAAVGPILMGRAFDETGSYEGLLTTLAVVTVTVATLMFGMPPYDSSSVKRNVAEL